MSKHVEQEGSLSANKGFIVGVVRCKEEFIKTGCSLKKHCFLIKFRNPEELSEIIKKERKLVVFLHMNYMQM